jgi:hypothetical protein
LGHLLGLQQLGHFALLQFLESLLLLLSSEGFHFCLGTATTFSGTSGQGHIAGCWWLRKITLMAG